MKIEKKYFGMLSSGKKVNLYILKTGELSLSVSTYGANLVSLFVPSRKNQTDDVLLGYSTLESYTHNKPHLGEAIGRFANRIADGVFTLNGTEYKLFKNAGKNSIHGGRHGFGQLLWNAECYKEKDGVFVRLELKSPDGAEGYPGELNAAIIYSLTENNELSIDYKGWPSAPCPLNFTSHAYFNLAGEGNGDVLSHELLLHSSSYLEVDTTAIPTGKVVSVNGGPYDFQTSKSMGADIEAVGIGYDNCFIVDGEAGKLRPCAEVFEGNSGRKMRLFSTQPAVQFYTGNYLDALPGKSGSIYNKYSGFCLETEHYPDSPNKPAFPSCIFGPDRPYHERTVLAFDW